MPCRNLLCLFNNMGSLFVKANVSQQQGQYGGEKCGAGLVINADGTPVRQSEGCCFLYRRILTEHMVQISRVADESMPDSVNPSKGKDMIRAILIVMILSISVTVGAQMPPAALSVAAGPGDRIIKTPKTAEWEGEWVSVSSQIDYLERRGIFQRAASTANGRTADDIRRAFQKRFSSDIGRVRIAAGRFTFLSPDGSTVIGTALYAYAGFAEDMSEGREIQWHRFTRTGGFGKYPVLVCSEPHGILGQWLIVHGEAVTGMKTPR